MDYPFDWAARSAGEPPAALEGVLIAEGQARVRFEGAGPEGVGVTVAKPWPNVVTELEANRGRYTDLPFMGKKLAGGATQGSAAQHRTLTSVRPRALVDSK